MRPERRTLTGLLLALVLIPLFAGVLGCVPTFPVPIGDPEEGWIDPAVSGVWVSADDPLDYFMLTPWDQRTWLVWGFEVGISGDGECQPIERPEDLGQLVELFEGNAECLDVEVLPPIKTWLSEHGGRRYLTLDFTFFGLTPDEAEWLVLRISRADGKRLSVQWVDGRDDGFAALPKTPDAYEEYLAAHADDEDLLEGAMEYVRVAEEYRDLIVDRLLDYAFN